jgi:hypothetical protein
MFAQLEIIIFRPRRIIMKYKITATFITTSTITKEVEAINLNVATANLLLSSNPTEWKAKTILKTNGV